MSSACVSPGAQFADSTCTIPAHTHAIFSAINDEATWFLFPQKISKCGNRVELEEESSEQLKRRMTEKDDRKHLEASKFDRMPLRCILAACSGSTEAEVRIGQGQMREANTESFELTSPY